MPFPHRVVNTLGFAAAGAGFLLPFVSVKSADHPGDDSFAFSWRGLDLTVGGEPHLHVTQLDGQTWEGPASTLFSSSSDLSVSGQPGLIAAAVLILAGLLAAFLSTKRAQIMLAALAGAIAATLIVGNVFVVMLNKPISTTDHLHGVGYGLWFVVGLLTILTIVNLVIIARIYQATDEPAAVVPSVGAGTPS